MGKVLTSRGVLTLFLTAACTAGSIALVPSERIGACAKEQAKIRASNQRGTAGQVAATAWSRKSDSYSLVWVDLLSFQQRGGAFALGTQDQGWRRVSSPDGRLLAVGGNRRTIEIIDLERRATVASIDVGGRQTFLAWPHPDRIMAITAPPWANQQGISLVIIDVSDASVIARQEVSGQHINAAVSENTIALITAPPRPQRANRVTQLWALRASGAAMTVRLDRVGAGYRFPPGDTQDRFGHHAAPGLAINPSGDRVLVFGVNQLVAEVTVNGGSISYRRLDDPPPMLSLDEADAKLANYTHLSARWLPNGMIAVFGHDQRLVPQAHHRLDHRFDPYGVVLFDPDTGRACVLEERADSALLAGGILFAFRAFTSGPDDGMGVAAFTISGELLWHRLGNDAIDFVQVLGDYAYITTSWRGWDTTVVEISTGDVVERVTGRPPDLVGAESSRPGVSRG